MQDNGAGMPHNQIPRMLAKGGLADELLAVTIINYARASALWNEVHLEASERALWIRR